MAVNDTQPLISHLIELRKRLMYSLIFSSSGFSGFGLFFLTISIN
ncbi:twin-arginine protein translocation system subunit TatC [Proteus mirabilis]|uniref:Twin-arginine protein translocation system subunit TatC n=1 Tax=Proteus mirabilis TaxID=584 RepID=A0A2X2BNI3_PROMI|nr:twin-arginine protein translocation system subunit TatC [Proteus mirabilis]